MNPLSSKLLLAVGIATTLGACASLPNFTSSSGSQRDHLAAIHSGLTRDDVRSLAGAPGNVTGASRNGETMWVYSFTDEWGYPSEFDVTFGADGRVTDTYSERVVD